MLPLEKTFDDLEILTEEGRIRAEEGCLLIPLEEVKEFIDIIGLRTSELLDCNLIADCAIWVAMKDLKLTNKQIYKLENL